MIINTNSQYHKRFVEFLATRDLKPTRQRSVILECFLCLDRHVSAEELYSEVYALDKGIGLATVFRTLRLISESGLAQEILLEDKTVRYERVDAEGHHDHGVCIKCHHVFEFRSEEIELLQIDIAKKHGLKLLSHRMNLYGICTACEAVEYIEGKK